MKVFYSVDEVCELSVYEMNAAGDSFDKYVAEECAQDYHDNHDGWELQSWPYTFSLRETEDGPVGARFAVDREAVPSFTALALKTPREGREG